MAKLKIERGTTYQRSGTYSLDGVLQSLIGATVRFTMKDAVYDDDTADADALLKKNVTNGDAEGNFVIALAPSDTATIEPGNYFYDIKVDVNSDGSIVYPLDDGTIVLEGSPTNRLS